MNPAPPTWYYVYLLKSKKDNLVYIGCTSNLNKRLNEHKEGKNFSTKKMLPIELIYFEAYKSKNDAFTREKHLKYHSSSLRNLKIRLKDSIEKGGAG